MSYDYEECLEVVCVDKLHCSLRDLKALVPIYSELAKLSGVDSEVLSRMNDLELMAKYAYTTIRDSVAESIECQARIDRYIELIPDEDADTYVKYEVDDTLKRDLLELARKIKKAVPHYEDLTDIKFNSLIELSILYKLVN